MKRFFAFKGDVYYPSRGMGDFYASYDTKYEAVKALTTSHEDAHLWEYWDDNLVYAVVFDSQTSSNVWDHHELMKDEA